mgnify:CR=1 FL=1
MPTFADTPLPGRARTSSHVDNKGLVGQFVCSDVGRLGGVVAAIVVALVLGQREQQIGVSVVHEEGFCGVPCAKGKGRVEDQLEPDDPRLQRHAGLVVGERAEEEEDDAADKEAEVKEPVAKKTVDGKTETLNKKEAEAQKKVDKEMKEEAAESKDSDKADDKADDDEPKSE